MMSRRSEERASESGMCICCRVVLCCQWNRCRQRKSSFCGRVYVEGSGTGYSPSSRWGALFLRNLSLGLGRNWFGLYTREKDKESEFHLQ